MKFWSDARGRVPFAVLGVFLLFGSAVTSTVIINLENKLAGETNLSLEIGEIDSMLSFMQADLSIALNYAGMKALDFVGKHPVTKPNIDSKVAMEYNGGNWDNYEGDKWKTFEDMKNFNMNWAKNITRVYLNPYILANYMGNAYNNGHYAINVVGKEDKPVENWKKITIEEVEMKLDREHTSPLSAPSESIRGIFSEPVDRVAVYWKFSLPLQIEIIDLDGNKIIGRKTIKVSTLVTSRMPLLMEMTHIYEKSLNGNGAFILTTLLSEIYTEARALAQYGGMYEKIPNIVDNRWLRYLINGVLLFEEFMVFNSIDPLAAVHLLLNIKDFAATGMPGTEEIEEKVKDAFLERSIDDIFSNMDENAILSISNNPDVLSEAEKNIFGPETRGELNVTRIAEDILYETIYTYYYYCEETGENKPLHEFKGYSFSEDDKKYVYISPPPYTYKNISTNDVLEEDVYHGPYLNISGKIYEYIPPKEPKGYERTVLHKLNEKVVEQLEHLIDETYKADFRTTVSISIDNIWDPYDPRDDSYWEKTSSTEWSYNASSITKKLDAGDVVSQFPYEESWIVLWRRDHTYVHKEPIIVNGSIVGWEITDQKTFTEIWKESITFNVVALNVINDVHEPFLKKQIILETSSVAHSRLDYNLYNISKDFVTYFTQQRENILKEFHKESSSITFPWKSSDNKKEYAMKWLEGYGGEVELALREILEMVKDDKINATIDEGYEYRKKDYNETIENHTSQLNDKFSRKVYKYIDDERYRGEDGNYISCAARVIAKMRAWYVHTIWDALNQSEKNLKESIGENITKALEKHNAGGDLMKEREDAKKKAAESGLDAYSLPSLQFGLTMPLKMDIKTENIKWEEQVGFAINQEPDYFTCKDLNRDSPYRFKVKNICLFGPTGLPILPTPITPWVITVNAWYIEVQGQFAKFEVTDTIGEMMPDLLFGNKETSFVRSYMDIRDPVSDKPIGENQPINFTISTLNVAIVPPGFVGDIDPYSYVVEPKGEGYWG